MISYFQAIVIGALQGITELFPISSLGHSVILPTLLGWNINQENEFFLVFLVATHLATALVLFGFFFKDWMLIIKGVFLSIKNHSLRGNLYARLGWLIFVSSLPAGILGLLLEKKLKLLFASPLITSVFLILNGLMLYVFEVLRRRTPESSSSNPDQKVSELSWSKSIKVGFSQCLALIPGFSRTGSTIGGSMLVGLNHEESARYSFLLATPIILAASLLKLPKLFSLNDSTILGPILVGSLCSAVAAYFSVKFLTKYFKTKSLKPFAVYCVLAGAVSVLILLMR